MRRNWELARAEKILREVQDEEGNPIDRASLVELSKLVADVGYEASYKRMKLLASAKDDNHLLSWFELQGILDKVRKDEQVCQRERLGFSKAVTDLYMRGFKTFAHEDESNWNDDEKFYLEPKDVEKMMKYIGTTPKYQMEKDVLKATIEKVESERSSLNFSQLLRLLREFMDQVAIVQQKKEKETAAECEFDTEEVETFRAIYNQKAKDAAHSIFLIDDLHKLLVTLGIGGLNNPQSNLRTKLEEVYRECDTDNSETLDFMEFMTCMKKLLDIDFGQIVRLTGLAANRAVTRGRAPSKRMSVAVALVHTMDDPLEDKDIDD
jgi:Ca2+-binding EF-hand superfamily protein